MKKTVFLITGLALMSATVFASMQSAINALNAKNYTKAFNEFLAEAKAGNADAQNYIGNLYSAGLGTNQNYKNACNWYQKAISNGNTVALNNLAILYQYGQGVKQDYNKAMALFNKAMNAGIPLAAYNLGIMYYNGQGVKQDYNKAIALFNKAANDNEPKAQSILGTIYYFGKFGVKQNYKKGYELVKQAATNGIPSAQLSLGSIYREGKAVRKDYIKAYMWYYVSFKNGNKVSGKALDLVKKDMTKKQIAEAKKLGDEWMKTHKEIDTNLLALDYGKTKIPTKTK